MNQSKFNVIHFVIDNIFLFHKNYLNNQYIDYRTQAIAIRHISDTCLFVFLEGGGVGESISSHGVEVS